MGLSSEDPDHEEALHVELDGFEGFMHSKLDDLCEIADKRFGARDPKLGHEPEPEVRFRGGPHLLGPMGWRGWTIPWSDDLFSPGEWYGKAKPANWLPALETCRFHAVWAANLPFAIAYVAFLFKPHHDIPPDFTSAAQHRLATIFDTLPGRLSPENVHPRVEVRWLLGAKVSEERMERLRQPIQTARQEETNTDNDDRLRVDIQETFPVMGSAAGSLLLAGWAPNIVTIYGHGGISLDGGAGGPFSAFCYSTGNQIYDTGAPGFMPLWGPRGLHRLQWPDFNFHPFVTAARQFVAYTLVEGGRIEEDLATASNDFERISNLHPPRHRIKGWLPVQRKLLGLQARTHRLEMDLHMAIHRAEFDTAIPPATSRDASAAVVRADEGWFWPGDDPSPPVTTLAEDLNRSSDEAEDLLASHASRIRGALTSIATDFQWYTASSIRDWTIGAVIVATAALVLTVIFIMQASGF